MSGEQNFWSRRRALVAAEVQSEEAAREAEALAAEHRVLEEKTDEELLAHFNLPDPDTLKKGDDFAAFMSKAIPDRLRRRALRKLWRSDPVLANLDDLVDYADDYTDKALVSGTVQTAYQVGKGMLKHVEEMARQVAERDAAKDAPVAEQCEAPAREGDVLLAAAPEEEPAQHIESDPSETSAKEAEQAYEQPTPRRMKFRTEEPA